MTLIISSFLHEMVLYFFTLYFIRFYTFIFDKDLYLNTIYKMIEDNEMCSNISGILAFILYEQISAR